MPAASSKGPGPYPGIKVTWQQDELLSWDHNAACLGLPSEWFFPKSERVTSQAARTCPSCPVRCECLAYALRHNIEYGTWGGTSGVDRARLKRDAGVRGRENAVNGKATA